VRLRPRSSSSSGAIVSGIWSVFPQPQHFLQAGNSATQANGRHLSWRIFHHCSIVRTGVTKHRTGLTDRTGSNSYRTSIRSPHRRLKQPLRAWWQLQTIGRCLRVRARVSGRFGRRCRNFLPVRSVIPVRCFVAPSHPNYHILRFHPLRFHPFHTQPGKLSTP